MRRIKIAVLFIAVCWSGASAQSLSGVGIKGGINYAQIAESGTMSGDTDFTTQFLIGAYSQFEILDFLFFRYELLYSIRGTSRTITSTAWSFTTNRKISLIEPAVLAHFPLSTSGRSRTHIFTGASLGVNVAASTTITGEYQNEPHRETRSDRSSYLPLDPGLVVGAGIEYRFEPVHIIVDVRYVHGLMNIWDRGAQYAPTILLQNEEPDDGGIPKMHSRTISFVIGLGI